MFKAGKIVIVGDTGKMSYPGQVIGCDYSNVKSIADEVEAFLFVGGGMFHTFSIALSTSKPTVIADPYDNKAFSIDSEAKNEIELNAGHVSKKSKHAKTFGVLVGLKPGQKKIETALKVKEIAEKQGKSAYILAATEITPEVLLEFPSIDSFVNTACPRISLDASSKFLKPVLTVNEFMVVSGESTWENLLKEGLFEN